MLRAAAIMRRRATTVTQIGSVALAGVGAFTVWPHGAAPLLWPNRAAACSASASTTAQHQPEWRRFAVETGTGTSLRREDHTAAAVRALQDALWRVSLTAYRALDKDPNSMRVEILIGVPKPEQVDHAKVLAVVPYGDRSIKVVKGGLAIDGGCGADAQGQIIVANAAAIVSLDVIYRTAHAHPRPRSTHLFELFCSPVRCAGILAPHFTQMQWLGTRSATISRSRGPVPVQRQMRTRVRTMNSSGHHLRATQCRLPRQKPSWQSISSDFVGAQREMFRSWRAQQAV